MSDLRQRDVVNINDGKRLGLVSDVDVDPATGRIVALIVPGPGKFFGILGGASDYVIHWDRIVRIGPDVILVDWNTERERGPGNPGGAFSGGFPPGLAGQAGPMGFPPGAAGMPAGAPLAGGFGLPQAGIAPGMVPTGPPPEVEPDQEHRSRRQR